MNALLARRPVPNYQVKKQKWALEFVFNLRE
jgi:hypothetical protein